MARRELLYLSRPLVVALLLALAVSVGCSTFAIAAGDIEAARLAIRTKQFAAAVRSLQPLATGGMAEAQYLLGLAQQAGLGTAEDSSAAERSLRSAAGQQHAAAAYALAGVLATRDPPQRAEAKEWVGRAAALGYPAATESERTDALPLAVLRPDSKAELGLRRAFAFFAARSDDAESLERVGLAEVLGATDEFGRSLLAVAAEYGSTTVIEKLVAAKVDVNAVDRYGITALMLAAMQSKPATTVALLRAGAKIDLVDRAGRAALMHAAWADQAAQIDTLAQARASLDLADARGWTALDVAIQRERAQAAERLRALGAVAKLGPAPQARSAGGMDPARTGVLYQGWAPLLVAVSRDDLETIKRLRAAGSGVNLTTPQGDSAVHVAIESGALAALQELLASGADVNSKNKGAETPLMVAARRDDLDAVRLILERHADAAGLASAFVAAAQRERGGMMSALLAAGATANAADADKVPVLTLAARAANAENVAALLAAGAKADAADSKGRTALWYAAAGGLTSIIDRLLQSRASVDAADMEGTPPLIAAAARGHAKVVSQLLAAGASANKLTKAGDTALLAAASTGQASVVELLLRERSMLDIANEFGDTPLIAASRGGFADVCTLLLGAGANTRLRNKDRSSASDVAEWRGFNALAKLVGG